LEPAGVHDLAFCEFDAGFAGTCVEVLLVSQPVVLDMSAAHVLAVPGALRVRTRRAQVVDCKGRLEEGCTGD